MHGLPPSAEHDGTADQDDATTAARTATARTGAGAPATVAVACAEFGWGSSGKLSAVLAALRTRQGRPLRFVGLGSALGRPLLAEHGIDRWYDLPTGPPTHGELRESIAHVVRAERVDAAVVVLDGHAAMALEAAGVPTVFVDSLPFLWTEGDRADLPLEVSVYCAQECVELPEECVGVLDSVRRLRWVEAIVGTRPEATEPRPAGGGPFRRALVSLGGLQAPRLTDWTCYPGIVVPAVIEALAAYGVREAHVAGNLPAGMVERVFRRTDGSLRVTAGPLSHHAFLQQLAACDVLLTSPGLTTLLEADSLSVPTVCLPPQNLSQIFNGRFHSEAVAADVRVMWPASVFSEDEALARRSRGEDAALRVIYGGIAAAADAWGTADAVRDEVLAALRRAAEASGWGGLASVVGTDGAAQVADALSGVLSGVVSDVFEPESPAPGPCARTLTVP
ncbi:hydroxymethylcytosylglucuronate/cytosylglucuronate synthase [Streptomyces formicae]|uniref:Hydroxymethylcytosylglucuronate/cytosylglucurona te synthase n=1 Tax=Streptomyces formicae TaxID=1616117 RepID=A0ABY3WJJ7_9ACTN|nr:hydroxymethylcytosylglucuronate/cytosylglucuronate synthase [Streptomyces formicae]UNM11786.1 hydroxymethylcytosylglucuronate/cytosylglucuronate synthase [Streptomyces formicae]